MEEVQLNLNVQEELRQREVELAELKVSKQDLVEEVKQLKIRNEQIQTEGLMEDIQAQDR